MHRLGCIAAAAVLSTHKIKNLSTAQPATSRAATPQSATSSPGQQAGNPPPGSPSAFGTAPPVGPVVSPDTFAEAEKLVRVEMTDAERAQAAGNWRNSMAALYERRTGPTQSRA